MTRHDKKTKEGKPRQTKRENTRQGKKTQNIMRYDKTRHNTIQHSTQYSTTQGFSFEIALSSKQASILDQNLKRQIKELNETKRRLSLHLAKNQEESAKANAAIQEFHDRTSQLETFLIEKVQAIKILEKDMEDFMQ